MIKVRNNSSDAYTFSGITIPANTDSALNQEQLVILYYNSSFVDQLSTRNLQIIDSGRLVEYPECIDTIRWCVQTTTPDTIDGKLACATAVAQGGGNCTITMKIPGTFSGLTPSVNGRLLARGDLFFSNQTLGDKLTSLEIIDADNVTGIGANTIIKSIHDKDLSSENQGWFFPPGGVLRIEAIRAFRFIPSGLYLRVTASKSGLIAGTLYVNIQWGKYVGN